MKKTVFALLLCLIAASVSAQQIYNSSGRKVARKPAKKTGFDVGNLVVGGDIRLGIGSGVSLGLAPIAGYKFNDIFSAGLRVGYGYDRIKYDFNYLPSGATTNIFSTNSYCAGIWGRVSFLQNFFVHVEGQYNFYQRYYIDGLTSEILKENVSAPSLLLGLGIKQPISDRVSFNITGVYDVLGDPNSYYSQMNGIEIRMGVLVGF
ncbi:MAG: hypothetical protein QM743_04370 [Chitinophagaceae bacterium]